MSEHENEQPKDRYQESAELMIEALYKFPPYREVKGLTVDALAKWLKGSIEIDEINRDTYYPVALSFVDILGSSDGSGWYHRTREIQEVEGAALLYLATQYSVLLGEIEKFVLHVINDYRYAVSEHMEQFATEEYTNTIEAFYTSKGFSREEAQITATCNHVALQLAMVICEYRREGCADRHKLISALCATFETRIGEMAKLIETLSARSMLAQVILGASVPFSELQQMFTDVLEENEDIDHGAV